MFFSTTRFQTKHNEKLLKPGKLEWSHLPTSNYFVFVYTKRNFTHRPNEIGDRKFTNIEDTGLGLLII